MDDEKKFLFSIQIMIKTRHSRFKFVKFTIYTTPIPPIITVSSNYNDHIVKISAPDIEKISGFFYTFFLLFFFYSFQICHWLFAKIII